MVNMSIEDENLFLAWFAGIVDGEGCFHIRAKFRDTSLNVSHQLKVALREIESPYLLEIQEKLGGKIYYSNKGQRNGVCIWQTTTFDDSIRITEAILPYLKIKKSRAEKYLEAIKLLKETTSVIGGKRKKGVPSRPRETVERVLELATSINEDSRSKADYKDMAYYSKILDRIYGE